MCLGMLCFMGLGIASTVYAKVWRNTNGENCELGRVDDDEVCDSSRLAAINSFQAVRRII